MHNPLKIIITDDSSEYIEGLLLMLNKRTGFTVIEVCSNGLELLNSPKLPSADLLLMDIQMPVMDGIESAKKIGFKYPLIPIIALTMQKEDIFLYDIISAGFKGFIYKPDVAELLFETIDKVMNKKISFPTDLQT